MLLLCMTVLLGPMMLPRYFLILFFGLPLILSFLVQADLFRIEEPPQAPDKLKKE